MFQERELQGDEERRRDAADKEDQREVSMPSIFFCRAEPGLKSNKTVVSLGICDQWR